MKERMILFLCAILSSPVEGQESATVIATSDVAVFEGIGGGGRADLRVSLGASFAPAEARFALEAFRLAGYDAVNLSTTDLDATAALLAESPVPLLSAAAKGAKPYVMKGLGKARAVIVGYSDRKEEPAVLRTLSSLPKTTDFVVLLAHTAKEDAVDLCRKSGRVGLCLVVGGIPFDPAPIKIAGTWVVDVPRGGRVLAKIFLDFQGTAIKEVRSTLVRPLLVASPELRALRKKYGVRPEIEVLLEKAAPKDDPEPPIVLPGSLPLDRVRWVRARKANRAVEILAHSVSLRSSYGTLRPAPGKVLLVVDAEWTNIMPLQFIYERKVPTEYRVKDLGMALSLVVDRRISIRLHPQSAALPGHLRVNDLSLPRLGSKARGNLVFEVPTARLDSAELRLLDFAHGHVRIPLVLSPAAAKAPLESAVVSGKNEVAEVGIYKLRKMEEWAGVKAPADRRFLVLDFRGRSHFTMAVDATAFRPGAKSGEKLKTGTVLDWEDAWKSLHLVVDGEFGYLPHARSVLPPVPRFLPDLPTGGDVVFLVPAKHQSLDLRVEFPNVELPGGRRIRTDPISLRLEGSRPTLPDRKAIAVHEDRRFQVSVFGRRVTERFQDRAPGAGVKFLVVDLTLTNKDISARAYEVEKGLHYYSENGRYLDLSSVTDLSPFAPARPLWIPAGERRTFQIVFEIPKSEKFLRLSYSGEQGKILNLTEGEAAPKAVKRVCPTCKEPVAPGDRFCQNCGTKVGP